MDQIDRERAWRDGNLDSVIPDACVVDVAVKGCRPEFVDFDGRTLLATADYGDVRPETRLLDSAALLRAHRTGAPGVGGASDPGRRLGPGAALGRGPRGGDLRWRM